MGTSGWRRIVVIKNGAQRNVTTFGNQWVPARDRHSARQMTSYDTLLPYLLYNEQLRFVPTLRGSSWTALVGPGRPCLQGNMSPPERPSPDQPLATVDLLLPLIASLESFPVCRLLTHRKKGSNKKGSCCTCQYMVLT